MTGTKRWHRIIVYADQTKEQAIALYDQPMGQWGLTMGVSSVSSSTNLARRLVKLEEASAAVVVGPAILCEDDETEDVALARWEAETGKKCEGEPLFIRFVGVEPDPRRWDHDSRGCADLPVAG